MNQRQATRKAHEFVAALIAGARAANFDGWADDEADHERIEAAMAEIQRRHERLAGGTR